MAQRIIGSEWCLRLQVRSYPVFALYFFMQYKGAAWLSRVRHGSFRVRHGSVGSVLACCMAGPIQIPARHSRFFLLSKSNEERATESTVYYKGTVSVLTVLAGTHY